MREYLFSWLQGKIFHIITALRNKGKSSKGKGLQIENKLDWKKHIGSECTKLSSTCYAIYRMNNIKSKTMQITTVCYNFYTTKIIRRIIMKVSPRIHYIIEILLYVRKKIAEFATN